MTTSRRRLGDLGEKVAASYLEGLGHRILARNWQSSHLEIDIISEDADGIHFVEVKSRTAPVSAAPEVNVTAIKQKRLTGAALSWLHRFGRESAEVFFDVVTVVFDGGKTDIEYYKQAFVPMYL